MAAHLRMDRLLETRAIVVVLARNSRLLLAAGATPPYPKLLQDGAQRWTFDGV